MSLDARDQYEVYSEDVGHLLGELCTSLMVQADALGRGYRRLLPIPPLCLFGTFGQVFGAAAGHGLPGKLADI